MWAIEVIARIAEASVRNLPATFIASRISGDRFALFMPETNLEAARSSWIACAPRSARPNYVHEGKKIDAVDEHRRGARSGDQVPAVACTRCRGSRLQGSQGSRSQSCRALSGSGSQHRAPLRGRDDRSAICARPSQTIGSAWRRSRSSSSVAQGPPRRFELLLRMIDTAGESVAPDKFFSAAERYQLATDIDRWVVQYALEILSSAAPALEKLGAHFAINISGQSVGDDRVSRRFSNRNCASTTCRPDSCHSRSPKPRRSRTSCAPKH